MGIKRKLINSKYSKFAMGVRHSFKLKDVEEIITLNQQFHLDIPNFMCDKKKWITNQVRKRKYKLF